MVSPISSALPAAVSGTGSSSSSSGSTGGTTSSDKTLASSDAFMKLLVTQLQNQDPMNPMQTYEFSAQLAQFTQVEQLSKIQDALAAQNQSTQIDTLVGQTALATGMIGRHVYADGDQLSVTSGVATRVRVAVGDKGGAATLHILDDTGKEVATRDLGKLVSGTQTLTLPDDLPAGNWHYSVSCKDTDGKTVSVATTTSGVVSGVSFTSGGVMLRIGTIEVPLDKVEDVDLAPNP